MAKRGRPTIYTEELAAGICRRIAEGESLLRICEDADMPARSAVMAWAADDCHGFHEKYNRAKQIRCLLFADEILDIADDGRNDYYARDGGGDGETIHAVNHENINRSKLRVQARQWLAAKFMPRLYGDKVDVTHAGAVDVNVELADLVAKTRDARGQAHGGA
jgi:hypothetical protein